MADINYCVWCGKKTPMEKMQLPDTPILEHLEDKINLHGRIKIWGDNSDWSKLDLDSNFEADVVRALGKIYDAGHIEKGEKPVHWCQDCGSALAEAEVEYKDKTSKSIDRTARRRNEP